MRVPELGAFPIMSGGPFCLIPPRWIATPLDPGSLPVVGVVFAKDDAAWIRSSVYLRQSRPLD